MPPPVACVGWRDLACCCSWSVVESLASMQALDCSCLIRRCTSPAKFLVRRSEATSRRCCPRTSRCEPIKRKTNQRTVLIQLKAFNNRRETMWKKWKTEDKVDGCREWLDWKERWRMTEDNNKEPSMTIAAPQMTGQAGGKRQRRESIPTFPRRETNNPENVIWNLTMQHTSHTFTRSHRFWMCCGLVKTSLKRM